MQVKLMLVTAALLQMVFLFGQTKDTIKPQTLEKVTVQGYRLPFQEELPLGNLHNTYITTGKKSEVIAVQDLPANLAEKTGRQIFAKIPGAFIYDMDGSGNQLNVSTRGLDPHRSWEYNVRQNGILTNSDMYGYPASHYSPPMEAIQKIEIIRGTASLQYGSQFGGMINYVVKPADTSKIASFESINSVGSYGLMSSFNALGGRIGKLKYYAYYQRRVSDGYRDNARSDGQGQFFRLQYAVTPNFEVKAELGRSQYIYQMPGPLTDAMFHDQPRQSTRSRNYFNPDIYLPSLTFDWKIGNNTRINWTSSAVLGARNSVQLIAFADVVDAIDSLTLKYKPRQVDIDQFHSYSSEWRLQQDYQIGRMFLSLVSGIRYTNNDLHRQQLGKGSTGTDFDLSITGDFGRDIHFKTQNIALFVENLFKISEKLNISAGVRWENGLSKMSGRVTYLPNDQVPQTIEHRFPLLGASGEYKIDAKNKIYLGWSQAYRPVIFADIIPSTLLEQTDPKLQDAFGHNAEFGIKGTLFKRLNYDITAFQILYRHRIGSLVLKNDLGQSYIWKTNIGDSRTNGLEVFLDYKIVDQANYRVTLFTASSFFDGVYLNGQLRNGNENTEIKGNRLETVPKWISRNGLQGAYKQFAIVLQYSYVSESFSDAINTHKPSGNGAKGLVPAYSIWDLNGSMRITSRHILRVGVNNLTNQQYFTKRPVGYPGQGIWSSDGRSIVVSLGIKL